MQEMQQKRLQRKLQKKLLRKSHRKSQRLSEEIEFDEDFPKQSAIVNLTEPGTYVIKAKPDDGWKFVKWTKNGEDFSEEPEITVEVAEGVEYMAVFETE